jgi:hypothetical protein
MNISSPRGDKFKKNAMQLALGKVAAMAGGAASSRVNPAATDYVKSTGDQIRIASA